MQKKGRSLLMATALVASLAFWLLSACGGGNGSKLSRHYADFVVRVGDERFVIRLVRPDQIQTARLILQTGQQKIVMGNLKDGHGGFNRDVVTNRWWSWHLDPSTVTFAEAAIELCDGRPSLIEENRDYWLNTVRSFCPWGSVLEGELEQ